MPILTTFAKCAVNALSRKHASLHRELPLYSPPFH